MASASRKTGFLRLAVLALALACGPTPTAAKGFLKTNDKQTINVRDFQADIESAMGAALGCGGHHDKEQLRLIEKQLTPMWNSLPKNSDGRVERRSLRYMTHRYFMQTASLLVRGFEPTRPMNESNWGSADILSQKVPGMVESLLDSEHVVKRGYTLKDAATMIAMIEELIFDSESHLLEKVYKDQRKSMQRPLSQQGLTQVLEDYMVNWMAGDDPESVAVVVQNRSLLETAFPHWREIQAFLVGEIKAFEHRRQQSPKAGSAQNMLAQKYAFDDAHKVVGRLTKTFANYWETTCAEMTEQLIAMDKDATGRVPLSKFYGTGLDADWRFGESEPYLRELGALDESSAWKGKQVIIPNYMQAASNCIVSTTHYLVCCINVCEQILGDLEVAIGAPVASPEDILMLVANMSYHSIEEDKTVSLLSSHVAQLDKIARASGGKVPLHGRLLAQWLHYVFPRECPFPHKTGVVPAALTPSQFGDAYIATEDEMRKHAGEITDSFGETDKNSSVWMSQWSQEEELIADYAGQLSAPWEGSSTLYLIGAVVFILGIGAGFVSLGRKSAGPADCGMSSKAHFV